MDATLALVIVGVLVLAAIVAAAGGFDRARPARRRTVVEERPADRVVERVVERPADRVVERVVERPVTEERTTRRVVE